MSVGDRVVRVEARARRHGWVVERHTIEVLAEHDNYDDALRQALREHERQAVYEVSR